MDNIFNQMLSSYETHNTIQIKNAIKEIIQEIVLCGLSRAGFFKKAAFYGGTALRIFYGLDRFSEDLDFSLLSNNPDFILSDYFPVLEKEVNSFGLNVKIAEKEKNENSGIQSAFLKANTREYILLFYPDEKINQFASNELIKVKFEVDINPPAGATFEHKYRLMPSPYEITLYDIPSLFAGKIHAVICRAWKTRVKGRDLYDYVFYLSRNSEINLPHLKARLVESGVWEKEKDLKKSDVKKILCDKFETIDFEQAKEDVGPFIADDSSLKIWSADFFKQITEQL